MTTTIEMITPRQAGEIMDEHYRRLSSRKHRQRPICKAVVNKYTNEIKRGFWRLTPQPIVFDVADNLLDGQHRLEAIRRAGLSVRMTVSRGWPVEEKGVEVGMIDVIDTGRARSVGEMLHLRGMAHAPAWASTARFIARTAWSGTGNPVLTISTVLEILDGCSLRGNIEKIIAAGPAKRFQPRNVGPLAYYHTARPVKALAFAEELLQHTASKGGAVHLLFRWLENHRGRMLTELYLKALCASLRAWDTNSAPSVLRPHVEAVEWLAGLNVPLRNKIRALVQR
jgi:hypothetical protein